MIYLLLIIIIILLIFIIYKNKNKKIMSDLQALIDEVAETKTISQSAITLLQGLKQRLDEAGTDPVKLQELRASLDTSNAELAAAVSANTPAEPQP